MATSSDNQNQPPKSVDFYTDVKVEETIFRWAYKDLLILPYDTGKYILSRQFCSSKNPEIKWRICMYPNGDKDESKNNISIYLSLLSKSTKVPAKVTISFWNSKTKHCFEQRTFDYEFDGGGMGYGWTKFCSHQKFQESTVVGGKNEDVIIVCKIITRAKLEDVVSSCLVVGRKEESANSMASDYNNLLKSKEFADFTLVSSDGVEFSTHKAILAARSPVFSAMLRNSALIEGQQNRAVIADIDSKTLEELVQYIYAEKCDNLDKMAKELLVASDKYQLDKLKNSAVDELNKIMSLKNVLDICVTAHLHNAPGLKKEALYFMKLNSNEIVKTCNWKHFLKEYPSLVTELVTI